MSEPTTTLTDILLAGLTLLLGARLAALAYTSGQSALWWWSLGFLAAAATAALGAASHGVGPRMATDAAETLWRWTLTAAGTSIAALVVAVCITYLSGASQRVVLAAIGVAWLAFLLAVLAQPSYRLVLYLSAAGMLVALAVLATAWSGGGGPATVWLLAGLLVAALGALTQAYGRGPATWFNHNDLYHVLQAASFLLLYRGAVLSGGV